MKKHYFYVICMALYSFVYSQTHIHPISGASFVPPLESATCRDFFADPETRVDIDQTTGRKIYRFGFYNTNTAGTRIINHKCTYIHASPIVDEDEGILFVSNFIAELQNPASGSKWGLVKINPDGTYYGYVEPESSPTQYYQIIKGKNAGRIYRVHWKNKCGINFGDYANKGHLWTTYCIPESKQFFVKAREYGSDPKKLSIIFIDLSFIDDPTNPDFRDSILITNNSSDTYLPDVTVKNLGILGSNSLNPAKSKIATDIYIGADIYAEKAGVEHNLTGYINPTTTLIA